jgi:hypothetical protein
MALQTTVRYVQEHKTVRIQYAVCAHNVAAAKRELLRRFTEQQVNGYEIEYVVAGLRAKKPRGSIFRRLHSSAGIVTR